MKGHVFERRQYQQRGYERAMQVKRGNSLLLVGPTGSGKTAIAAKVIKAHLRKGHRVLFLAHAQRIVDQAYEGLIANGLRAEDVGVLMASDALVRGHAERIRPDAPVQVCGVLTLLNRDVRAFDVAIVDEAHHAAAESYATVMRRYPEASVIGLTATPRRFDGRPLDMFGDLFVIASPADLIARGYLAKPIVYSKPDKLRDARMKAVRVSGHDYNREQLGAAMRHRKLVGNLVTEWQRLAQGHRTVGFAANVAHSKACCARFNKAGIRAEHIDESTTPNEREAVLARLESGKTRVVWTYGLLGEGWHQPSVKCAILARPTRSEVVYLQQAGRILSPWGNQRPIVLDHAGNVWRFGLPDMEREHSLEGREREKGQATVKACPLGHMSPLGAIACDECGHEFPIVRSTEEIAEEETRLERVRAEGIVRKLRAFVRESAASP